MHFTSDTWKNEKAIHSFVTPQQLLRRLRLATLLVMTFGTFKFFPSMTMLQELCYAAFFIFLTIPYLYWKSRYEWSFSSFELYVLAMMTIIPLLSGFAAWKEFSQPMIYGILAQRNMTLSVGSLALIYGLRQKLFSLSDIEKTLVLLAWGTMLLYLFIMVIFNPEQFAGENLGFAVGGYVQKAKFTFDNSFIIFGFYYYAFLGFRGKRSKKHYLLALLLLTYLIVGVGGRSMLVSIVAAYIFFIYRKGSFSRLLVFIPKLAAVLILFVALLYLVNADHLMHLSATFSDAFTVVLTGQKTGDASANARLFESALARPYISKHWLLGNGDISNQWHGGYKGVLGACFYPSDIGFIGILYMYGIIGTLLFALQFRFAWRYAKQLPDSQFMALVDAIKGFLAYYAIYSLATGIFVHFSAVSFLFIALMGYIAVRNKENMALSAYE